MKRICSWCNQEMGAGLEARSGMDQVITHGICAACAANVLADIAAVELDLPERQPNSVLSPIDFQATRLGWQRPA